MRIMCWRFCYGDAYMAVLLWLRCYGYAAMATIGKTHRSSLLVHTHFPRLPMHCKNSTPLHDPTLNVIPAPGPVSLYILASSGFTTSTYTATAFFGQLTPPLQYTTSLQPPLTPNVCKHTVVFGALASYGHSTPPSQYSGGSQQPALGRQGVLGGWRRSMGQLLE